MRRIVDKIKNSSITQKSAVLFTAAVLAAGGFYGSYEQKHLTSELTSFVDSYEDGAITIDEDTVPLAKTDVSTNTQTKKTSKTVKLKKASKKTYQVKKPTKTKKTKKTTSSTQKSVTVETTTVTSVVEKYKKKSKNKVVTTTVKTTTVTTTSQKSATATSSAKNVSASNVSASADSQSVKTVNVEDIAPKADTKLLKAYSTLGFGITINPSVSYSGYFNAKSRSITLKKEDSTAYHELGHFLAFLAGQVDTKTDFINIYNEEKSKFSGTNKSYMTQNSSEYFAESYKNYVENPSALKKERPKTYQSIDQALNKITDSYVEKFRAVYSVAWTK
jgi:hypothetical protein